MPTPPEDPLEEEVEGNAGSASPPERPGKAHESVTVRHERRRARSRHHQRFEVSEESEDWVISYMDMVTLIMCAFVVIAALLDLQSTHSPQQEIKGSRSTPAIGSTTDQLQAAPAIVAVASTPAASDEPGENPPRLQAEPGVGGTPSETQIGAPPALSGSAGFSGAAGTTGATISAATGGGVASTTGATGGETPTPPTQIVPENPAEEARFAETWRQAIAQQGLSEQVSITAKGRSVIMQIQDKILFPSGSDDIEDGGRNVIRRLAPLLAHSTGNIRVEGHTDNVPINNDRFASNWELSAGRASTVVHALIDAGIPPTRLQATGFADTRPEQPNDTETGRSRNRRVNLVIEN